MKQRARWPIQQLVSKRQCRMLKRWPREVETLSDVEENTICICKPETGVSLDDEEGRSTKDLIDY
jgi:hypothetical protein